MTVNSHFSLSDGRAIRCPDRLLASALADAGVPPGTATGRILRGEDPVPVSAVRFLRQRHVAVALAPHERAPRAVRAKAERSLSWASRNRACRKACRDLNDPGAIAEYLQMADLDPFTVGYDEAYNALANMTADFAAGTILMDPDIARHAVEHTSRWCNEHVSGPEARMEVIEVLQTFAMESLEKGLTRWMRIRDRVKRKRAESHG